MGTGLHPEARPSNILIQDLAALIGRGRDFRIVFDVNNLEPHLDFVLDFIKQKYPEIDFILNHSVDFDWWWNGGMVEFLILMPNKKKNTLLTKNKFVHH